MAWSREWCLDRLILAVGHLRLEDLVLTRRIELLLPQLFEIIDAWAWIIRPWLIVMPVVGLLEEPTVHLAQIELVLWSLRMNLVLLRSVGSWSDLVEAAARVRSRGKFPGRYAGSDGVWNDGVVLVLLRFVFEERLVDRLQFIPLWRIVIVARIRIVQVRRPLNQARPRSSRAKSWDLCEQYILRDFKKR